MKKNTLFAFFAFLAAPLFAQDNLVQNGDFEDLNYTPFVYEDNVKRCPDMIAGWDKREGDFKEKDFNNLGLDKYYVRGEIVTDSLADTGGSQCIRIQRYEWSGSEKGYPQGVDGGIQQTIEVAPDTEYSFSMLYRLSNRMSGSTVVPAFWVIYEGDETATETQNTRKKLYNEMDNKWYSTSKKFTTQATTTRVRLYLGIQGGYVQSWGANMGMFADYDNVSLIREGAVSVTTLDQDEKQELFASVSGNTVTLEGVDITASISIRNVPGAEIQACMPNAETMVFTLPQGIYIIRNGSNREPLKVVI